MVLGPVAPVRLQVAMASPKPDGNAVTVAMCRPRSTDRNGNPFMKSILTAICVLAFLCLGLSHPSFAQQTSAQATPTQTPSSGAPSSLEIAQNTLAFKRAELTRQLREIQRCIANASNPILLRDPQGNINRVPQTDLTNCSRKLAQLQRQLSSLQRQSNVLVQDATFQSILAQDALLTAQRKLRIGK